jgi:hypothetical protein
VRVRGPDGIVVLMAAWMFDPVACAAMTAGAPVVEWAALVELRQRLLEARPNEASAKEPSSFGKHQTESGRGIGASTSAPPPAADHREPAQRAGGPARQRGCGRTKTAWDRETSN